MPQFMVLAIAYEAPYVVFCNINFEFPTFSCTMSLFFCVLDFAVSTTSEIFSAASLLKSALQREPLSNTIQVFNHLLCNPQKCTRTIISKSYSGPGTFFCMVIYNFYACRQFSVRCFALNPDQVSHQGAFVPSAINPIVRVAHQMSVSHS